MPINQLQGERVISAPIIIITPGPKPRANSIVDSHTSSVAAVYNETESGDRELVAHGFQSYEAAYCWLHGATHDFSAKSDTSEE